jgi:hypothetical protein
MGRNSYLQIIYKYSNGTVCGGAFYGTLSNCIG